MPVENQAVPVENPGMNKLVRVNPVKCCVDAKIPKETKVMMGPKFW